jgi:Spy/CpxP family protein refolding chaperone
MKKTIVIIFLMMVSLGISFAQTAQTNPRENKSPEERAQLQTDRIVKSLALSDEQAAKLKEANLQQAKKMDALKTEFAHERQEFRKEAGNIHASTEQNYKAILTPEQYQKYQQNKEKQVEKRKAKINERRSKR